MSADFPTDAERSAGPGGPPRPESVSVTHWEPKWEPPTISARCPSCGTVAERGASAWALRSPVVRATMACGCGRVWEVTATEPEKTPNPYDRKE